MDFVEKNSFLYLKKCLLALIDHVFEIFKKICQHRFSDYVVGSLNL